MNSAIEDEELRGDREKEAGGDEEVERGGGRGGVHDDAVEEGNVDGEAGGKTGEVGDGPRQEKKD